MKLFDSHSHIYDKVFKPDIENVLKRAHKAGVSRIMAVGISRKSSQESVIIAEKTKGIYASVGVHPHEAKNCSPSVIDSLCKTAKKKSVRAWGEIGLDFNRMYSPREDQEKWFIEQLKIAKKLNLPVILHERDSKGRFLEILKTHLDKTCPAVVHCFTGDIHELKEYINMGLYIGITGIITIKTRGKRIRQLAPLIPKDRILIETDAPYLTPLPEKNKTRRNEPAFVKYVMLKLAEVIGDDPESLAEILWNNTCRLFRIN